MNMESPVRICLGAALVVNLLLLSFTVSAFPHETTQPTLRDDKIPRIPRANSTWPARKPKNPDSVALNELHPKESVSEEHTEKNAKYKDRGRVRFNVQKKTTTETPPRKVRTSTDAKTAKLIIVTPTPEVKKPAQIIDSMRNYKKTKIGTTSTSVPVSVKSEVKEEEEYEEEEDEEEKVNYEKYSSDKYHDSNFFTIPSYNDDFNHDSIGSDNKVKSESISPYGSFSSYFPEASYGKGNDNDEPYKSESFFDFDSELTTPKHDFFDKKYEEISKSIIKNLASVETKSPPPNSTNIYKILKENTGVEKLSNGSPNNKSTVIIKNTKEIRLLDNDQAGTSNTELSDVHGTSIYYEMSVLSTETYNIDNTDDDDCDNDTLPSSPTASTSSEEELASVKPTQSTVLSNSLSPKKRKTEAISTLSSNYSPISSIAPSYYSSISPTTYSYEGVTATEKSAKSYSSSSFNRNRNYSKRLNFTGVKDSPNSVSSGTEQPVLSQNTRTRKFHYTTPKIKPIWMAPRRNVTRTSYPRTTTAPSTIYVEHFNVKDRVSSTPRPRQPSRTTLTTVSSEIDPVLQGDVSGVKKIVHSQSISDNSIPTLWKRGSTRYSSSTETSTEVEAGGVSDLEIPPTLTAWALASLRSPPPQVPASNTTTTSTSTMKSIDENELQKVGEVTDKKEPTQQVTTTTASTLNNDIIPKLTEIEQNKLPWKPISTRISVVKSESKVTKSESQPAESNISVQSSVQPESTSENKKALPEPTRTTNIKTRTEMWVPVTEDQMTTVAAEIIPPVDTTKSTGFESITKFPGGHTTPLYETGTEQKVSPFTEVPTTTDYEITTIRFSYTPTEEATEAKEDTTTTSWHPVFPTRTKATTKEQDEIKHEPITTYRPKYVTTTEIEEPTTLMPESTSKTETTSSSEVTEKVTEKFTEIQSTPKETELVISTTQKVEKPTTTEAINVDITTESEEITTMADVSTETHTEKEESYTSTELSSSTEIKTTPSEMQDHDSSSEQNSGSNEVITQEPKQQTTKTTTEIKPETTEATTEYIKDKTTQMGKVETTVKEDTTEAEVTTESATKPVGDLEDLTTTEGDVTTETSSRVLTEESSAGAAVAIAVSTIGVIALILLVGLLLVVRRRGRRGVYAQRCTPVSLDAYSLDSVSVGLRKGAPRLRASKRSYGNPAFDDEVTSHPMQYAALANFALDVDSMLAEFAEIPSVTVRPDEVPPGCEDKNRYSNVLPLPETRVPLNRIGNDATTEYINANFITGPGNIKNYYIACQAPLPNTVVDFWRMVWEQHSRVIVMLTEYMENGVEKCYEYLPPSEVSDNKRTFGDYQIVLMKREQRDKYAISSVQLTNTTTRTWREVTHLWYFWPAKGVPEDYDSVIDFLSEMRSYMKISQTAKEYDDEGVEVIYGDQSRSSFHNLSKLREDNGAGGGLNVYSPARAEEQMRRNGTNGTLGRMKASSEVEGIRPCTVVCASGAGRSAAIIAADICARALAAASADVPRVVRELRAQRPHSLSNRHHYIFLYKLLSEYGNKLMGGGVDTI